MGEGVIFYFKLLGILFIFVLGVKEFLTKGVVIQETKGGGGPKGLMAGVLTGMLVYISNPTLILTMTGLGAFIKSLDLFPFHQSNIVGVSLGLGLGAFFWFALLVELVGKFREAIKNKYFHCFGRVSGGLMIGLALLMTSQLYFGRGEL